MTFVSDLLHYSVVVLSSFGLNKTLREGLQRTIYNISPVLFLTQNLSFHPQSSVTFNGNGRISPLKRAAEYVCDYWGITIYQKGLRDKNG